MEISDWIRSSHNMNKITGYVTGIINGNVEIQVTIPSDYGRIEMKQDDVWLPDEFIWMDDLQTLIDLSLKIRDKEWFQKWVHELSLWRPVAEVEYHLANELRRATGLPADE